MSSRSTRQLLLLGPPARRYEDGSLGTWRQNRERVAFLVYLSTRPGRSAFEGEIRTTLFDGKLPLQRYATELRNDLPGIEIHRSGGGRWSLVLAGGITCDVDECDALLRAAQDALARERYLTAATHARAAIQLFRGDPLEGLNPELAARLNDVIEDLERRRDRALAVLTVAAPHDDDVVAWQEEAVMRGRSTQVGSERSRMSAPGTTLNASMPVPTVFGRDDLVDQIVEKVREFARPGRIIVQLSGRPGIGKSSVIKILVAALAPDVERVIALDLRGNTHRPLDTRKAQADALEVAGSSGVAPHQLTDAYHDLFRGRSGTSRTLLVLDHVEDAGYARPLLPHPTDPVVVIVASRRDLTGLDTTGRAVVVDVPPVDEATALEILAESRGGRIPGPHRATARALAAKLGHVPLYLDIAGRKIALGEVTYEGCVAAVDELNINLFEDSSRVAAELLAFGLRDAAPEVRHTLAAAALGAPVVHADLLTIALDRPADRHLAELGERRMLDPRGPGSWTMHSLIRGFGRAQQLAPKHDAQAADVRMAEFVIIALSGLARRVDPARMVPEQAPGRPIPADLAWFDDRRDALVALVGRLHDARDGDRCWRTAAALEPLLDLRITGPDLEHVLAWAEAAAGGGTTPRHGWTLLWRARHTRVNGEFADAFRQASLARTVLSDAHDQRGAAAALLLMADIRTGLSDEDDTSGPSALDLARHAFAELEKLGEQGGMARAAESIGEILAMTGHPEEAEPELNRALALYRSIAATRGAAATLRLRAGTLRRLGDLAAARDDARTAITAAEACGDEVEAARARITYGVILTERGDLPAALASFDAAQQFFAGVYDLRWRGVSDYHFADTLHAVDPRDDRWRVHAERALASLDGIDERYAQMCRDLMAH